MRLAQTNNQAKVISQRPSHCLAGHLGAVAHRRQIASRALLGRSLSYSAAL